MRGMGIRGIEAANASTGVRNAGSYNIPAQALLVLRDVLVPGAGFNKRIPLADTPATCLRPLATS